ncbi:MAG: hypothetical protein BMS9Abin11_1673 [Gammaproteobacteria bacterium]|nr:MAG: hypothetical protein BMS9Abin11_1673 [Gammaproteobacteria bacterium]
MAIMDKLKRYGLLGLLLVGIVLALVYRDHLNVAGIEQWIKEAGAAGPILFISIYAVGTLLFLPGSVLTLAGGAMFGPVYGTLYNLTGATLGATLSFLAARYLVSDWIEHKTGKRLAKLQDGVAAEGWRFVAFVRLVPLFPFNLLNYALGLTRIKLSHYIIASYIFMLPGAIAYTYLGYAGREALVGDTGLSRMVQLGSIALALLALVAFLPRIIGRLRRSPMLESNTLKQLISDNAIYVLDVRSPEEHIGELGRIIGSCNIPQEQLSERLDELAPWLEKPIAIICRTDRRSAKAAQLLSSKGFVDVRVVRGGMTAWNQAGLPVEIHPSQQEAMLIAEQSG